MQMEQFKKKLPQFTCAVLNVKVIPTTGQTPYSRIGSYPILIIVFFSGFIPWILDRKLF